MFFIKNIGLLNKQKVFIIKYQI